MIPGTLTLARELGLLVRSAQSEHRSPIEAVLERLGGFPIFQGKVVDVERRTEAGFARGSARLEGSGVDAGYSLRIDFQNENPVAERDDEVLATVPDLITVLEAETGEPITTEELRYGFRSGEQKRHGEDHGEGGRHQDISQLLQVEDRDRQGVGTRTIEEAGHGELVKPDQEHQHPSPEQGGAKQGDDHGAQGGEGRGPAVASGQEQILRDIPHRAGDRTMANGQQLGQIGEKNQEQGVPEHTSVAEDHGHGQC